ncbi:MAG: DUF3419 family protein [Planctomycetota bacterium]|nr:DUF3419 family protein [Planctomycetota bacterium]
MPVDPWAKEVSRFPVAFSQVREDALGDMELVDKLGRKSRVLMVASGGCTAAFLLSSKAISHITIVDPNPAQIILAKLKFELLRGYSCAERLNILGHQPMALDARKNALQMLFETQGIAEDCFGPFETTVSLGPDHVGRYEQVFHQLRKQLSKHQGALEELVALADPRAQYAAAAPSTALGQDLDRAFDAVFSLDNLVEIFGTGATSNRVQPFSKHFRERTRIVLKTLNAHSNPYLSQVFLGRYTSLAPWIGLEKNDYKVTVDSIEADMLTAVRTVEAASYDLIHLSNSLDWLGPDSVEQILSLAARALKKGGATIIRQLNSTVDIPGAKSDFQWDHSFGDSLLLKDRSFFYRAIYVGYKI